jgi:hypothetical protein
MNEIGSLLITTTCLVAAGLGIFLFSSKSNEPTTNSKGGKKQPTNKKSIENSEPRNDNKENDINIYDDINEDSSDDISEEYAPPKQVYNNKSKPKNKTKRNVNKFSYSKKKYYY